MRAWILLAASCLAVASCAYPRRTTTLHSVGEVGRKGEHKPQHLYHVQVLGADVPLNKRTGLEWDADGSAPDPYVRILLDREELWQSETRENTHEPEWNTSLPRNVRVGPETKLRVELWDRDRAGRADPIGVTEHLGLPANALPGAVARLSMSGGATVSLRVDDPHAHRGTGILEFEVHSDALIIREVARYSPAARAGLDPGDRIIAIDGKPVSELSGPQASSQLSMASERGLDLAVLEGPHDDPPRRVRMDKGYVWLLME